MLKRILFLAGTGISLFLVWFAIYNYRASGPIAGENLRGLALSIVAAFENITVRDPSFRSLAEFHPPDVAFFAVIDKNGIYRFHSNPDLIGTSAGNGRYEEVFGSKSISEERVTLGTGEKAYEIYTPLYIADKTYVLRLVLHTYRADEVVRRAQFNLVALMSLLGAGWLLGAVLYRFAVREERHQLEMARRERLAQMGEMGAMLAHEIRNPLAGIKGYAQIIAKKPEEARNAGFAQRIVAETLRLEDLVSDLLAFARNDSYAMVPFNIRELIAYAVSLIRPEAEQHHVTVGFECSGDLMVVGNRDKLGQVLLNLVKNAVQAMPEGGSLRVTAEASGKNVIIRVSDSGEGIAAEHMTKIFDPFFTTKARGTGIGLALCKKIVEEHQGRISVESTPGAGTSVSVALPGSSRKGRRGSDT